MCIYVSFCLMKSPSQYDGSDMTKKQGKIKIYFLLYTYRNFLRSVCVKNRMSKFNTSRSGHKTFMGNPYKAIKKNASSLELAINFSDIHYYWRYSRNTYMVFQTNTTIIAKYPSQSHERKQIEFFFKSNQFTALRLTKFHLRLRFNLI